MMINEAVTVIMIVFMRFSGKKRPQKFEAGSLRTAQRDKLTGLSKPETSENSTIRLAFAMDSKASLCSLSGPWSVNQHGDSHYVYRTRHPRRKKAVTTAMSTFQP